MKRIEVVAGIIVDKDKFFATQRGYGESKGFWEFPGGKMEAGESSEQALARELREELAIDVNVGKFLCTVEHDYPASNSPQSFRSFSTADLTKGTSCDSAKNSWKLNLIRIKK